MKAVVHVTITAQVTIELGNDTARTIDTITKAAKAHAELYFRDGLRQASESSKREEHINARVIEPRPSGSIATATDVWIYLEGAK